MPSKRQPAKPRPRWKCEQCARLNDRERLTCKCGAARPWKRAGLHRLECPLCPGYAYFTVAELEQCCGQLPQCHRPDCTGTLEPTELELAFLLGVDAPVVHAYRMRAQNSERAQERKLGWGRAAEMRSAGTANSMTVNAAAMMARERRERARSNRLQALKPAAEPMPF